MELSELRTIPVNIVLRLKGLHHIALDMETYPTGFWLTRSFCSCWSSSWRSSGGRRRCSRRWASSWLRTDPHSGRTWTRWTVWFSQCSRRRFWVTGRPCALRWRPLFCLGSCKKKGLKSLTKVKMKTTKGLEKTSLTIIGCVRLCVRHVIILVGCFTF